MDIREKQQLLDGLRRKDRDAQKRLYEQYAPMLMAICHRYIPDRADAEDVLQECFIRIFDKTGTFQLREKGSFEGWMARIAVNGAINWLRERKRLAIVPLPDDLTEEEEPSYQGISQEAIQAAIRSLPDGYRTVLNLYVFEDRSHQEIAEMLGITEGTSASQLHRARNLLWKKLKALQK